MSEPGCDGVFRYVEALAGHLLTNGIKVHLAYSDSRSCDDLQRLVNRIEDSGGSTLNMKVGNAPQPRDALALLDLYGFIRESGAQVIHAHSSKAGALARSLRLFGIKQPIFYSPHAYYGLHPRHPMKTAFFNSIERLLKTIGHTVNTSGSEAGFARQRLRVSGARQSTIHNGVDTARFLPATQDERATARTALGLPQDAVVLGSICRVSEQKDPFTLYRAFCRIARQRKDVILYHLGGMGSPEEEGQLRTIVDSNNLHAQVIRQHFRSDTVTVYQALDALVLTSRYEGLSLVLLEGMASGLPLILSTAPGNIDVKADGLNRTWWGRVGSVSDFAEAMEDCIRTARAGCNHREVAVARYSQAGCFDSLIDNYEAALKKRSIRLLPYPRKPTPTPAA